MAQEKLEDLSIEMLKKKKKNASFLMGVMIGIIILTLVMLGISIATDKSINVAVYIPGLILVFFTLILYTGIKKIDAELKNRETTK
jgi:cytochrome c biogenesis protein CcdA